MARTSGAPPMARTSGAPPMVFSGCKILHSSAYMISEKAIRFWRADYDPDRAQKLISLSMSSDTTSFNSLFEWTPNTPLATTLLCKKFTFCYT